MKDLTKKQLQDKIDELQKAMLTAPDFIPWKPTGGIYYVAGSGQVSKSASVMLHKEFGSERASKEQAEKARDAMRAFNRLLAYKDEFAPDFVHDETGEVRSYCVALDDRCEVVDGLDVEYGRWVAVMCNASYKMPTDIYFPADVAETLADNLNSGEVTL